MNKSKSITPLRLPFHGALDMPGSKSHANRAIIAAALAKGETRLRHATPCDDVAYLVENLQRMGFDLTWEDRAKGALLVRGGLPAKKQGSTELFCGNAGTTLRFLTSLACVVPGDWVVTGDAHMLKRPIGALLPALQQLGAQIEADAGTPPLRIRGANLPGGATTLDASTSSQYLSSLLLVAPALPKGMSVQLSQSLASPSYVALTRKVLADFGVELQQQGDVLQVAGTGYRSPGEYVIEGDWSAAGSFLVLQSIAHSQVSMPNLDPESLQGDRLLHTFIESLTGLTGESVGDLQLDCTDIPDQVMNLAVLAAHRHGETRFVGARNLRFKECDRLAVITAELSKVGVDIQEHEDGLLVRGPSQLRPASLDPHDDHRMAMVFAILAAVQPGIQIQQPDCVSKSYPAFFADLHELMQQPACIALAGMRGCGKSTLGKALAAHLQLDLLDTDAQFAAAHGPIADFVAKHGWPEFRRREEEVLQQSLQPGRILALGGGVVESKSNRELLQSMSQVVWLDESLPELQRRLQQAPEGRPALTAAGLIDELSDVLAARRPLFAEIAKITVPGGLATQAQVEYIQSQLQQRCSW